MWTTSDEFEARSWHGEFIGYVQRAQGAGGVIGHIGLSHPQRPRWRKLAALVRRDRDAVMFSVNPAFDLLPATASTRRRTSPFDYADELGRHGSRARAELYALCEREGVGLTVMKGYAGGRLFSAEALPVRRGADAGAVHPLRPHPPRRGQRPGGLSTTPEHVDDAVAYETATEAEKDYASVSGRSAPTRLLRPVHLLRPLRPLPGGHRYRHGEQVLRPGHHAAARSPPRCKAHYGALDAPRLRTASPAAAASTRCPFGVPDGGAHGKGQGAVWVSPARA